MKKKNVLTMAMSLALVGVIAVGGTMAYLTASDGAITNSFDFISTDGNDAITVTLKEPKPVNIGSATIAEGGSEDEGWTYENVVPGQTLEKKPNVTVTAYTPTYVYIKIESDNATVNGLNGTTWKQLGEEVSGVYYHEVKSADISASNTVPLGDIFTSVTIADIDEDDMAATEPSVTISVAAVAVGSFTGETGAMDAYTAANVEDLFEDTTV